MSEEGLCCWGPLAAVVLRYTFGGTGKPQQTGNTAMSLLKAALFSGKRPGCGLVLL